MPRKIPRALQLDYQPHDPARYRPKIGVIGCGGIVKHHLTAYRAAKYQVAALCDIDLRRAKSAQTEFFPAADIYADYQEVLRRKDIEVVDITTHPLQRSPIIEAAILAGKHVLSQKPFVLDLELGQRLVDLADSHGVLLAVNQNGRWAPHFSYMRQAVQAGLLGDLTGVHLSVHWDHSWVAGTPFEKVKHLILYDYAIHWFDMVVCLLAPQRAKRVFASTARTPTQTIAPALLGQALIEFEHAQATLAFDAHTPIGRQDRSMLAGALGSIRSSGPGNSEQRLVITTADGEFEPRLKGKWFSDGFHGAMGDLLCAIESGVSPTANAAENLRSLELCFAAVASAEQGRPIVPGSVRRLPE